MNTAAAAASGIDLETVVGIETRAQSQLRWRVRDFRLAVGASGLILHGRAHSYYAKQLAHHAVMMASRLPIQANEIEVF